MLRTFLVLLLVTLSYCDDSEWLQVRTSQGDVRGRKDADGGLYNFYNIPYATVPVGTDRFKAPLPGPVWSEPLDAVDRGIICIQPVTPFMEVSPESMQEDCLVANVFVPDTKEKNLPVIVHIHGGGFEIGYGNMLGTKQLVKTKKIIVVNFNYRLGVHGFLCLGTKDAPGNAGLKDQVALLRWVKKNIANFGGDPDNVTINGGSAGSLSVHLVMLSKAAQGLFNKVIPESGPNLGSIAVQVDPLENARDYAKMFNFSDVDNFQALTEFYLNTPLESIQKSTFISRTDATMLFSSCIERKIGGEVFLDDSPLNIIKNNKYKKVPMLFGNSNMEGLSQMMNFDKYKVAMNEKFSDFLPGVLHFENPEEKEEVGRRVKEFYFGDKPVGEETVLTYIEYLSDTVFTYGTVKSVQLEVASGHDQIYLYEYSFVDESTPLVPYTNVRGATHCAQTGAVLDGVPFVTSDESNLSEELKNMKSILRDMWYNFAAYGKPVPEGSSLPAWPPVGADGGPYMDIGTTVQLRGPYAAEKLKFWDSIYDKYYRGPLPPQPPVDKVEL